MTCCFIGHRRIKYKKELASRLQDNICYLLEQGVATFLFGDHSEFNTLCYKVVSELREVYPQIRRIHYRTDYPDADAYTMQFLLDGYEDSICPDGVAAAGKAAYVERNQAMIQATPFCSEGGTPLYVTPILWRYLANYLFHRLFRSFHLLRYQR